MALRRLVMVSLLLFFGATAGGQCVSAAVAPTPQGTLHVVDTHPWSQIAPIFNVVERLVDIDEDGRLVPGLATEWHWRDGRTLDMTLRQGVTFHNGEGFDAATVDLNWQAYAKLREHGGEDLFWMAFPEGSHLKTLDAYQIQFRFSEPDNEALVRLAMMHIVNRQFYRTLRSLDRYWDTLRSAGPWGTGPYKWVEGFDIGTRRSSRVVLEANTAYWNPDRFPRLRQIVFAYTVDPKASVAHITQREGQVDLLTMLSPLATLQVAQSAHAKVIKERGGLQNQFGLFNMRHPKSPWRDRRLRWAINHAINRTDLIQYAAKGNGIPTPALLPPQALGYDSSLPLYAFDPAETKRLLQEAGYANGLSVTLIAPETFKASATVISKMLEQAGFKAQAQLLHADDFRQRLSRHGAAAPAQQPLPTASAEEPPTWDIALATTGVLGAFAASFPAPLYRVYALDGRFDWVHERPELAALYQRVRGTPEPDQQAQLLRQMEQHTRNQAYFLFLYAPIQLYAVNKSVEFEPHASGLLIFGDTRITDAHWSVRPPAMQ